MGSMKVSLDLVIDSGDEDVDMEYALQTLLAASGVTSVITEAVLRGKVKEKIYPKNEVRTKLKHSFTGSYGMCFDVIILDKKIQNRLTNMTRSIFSEVMSYYIYESLFIEAPKISNAAEGVIKSLEDIEDELTKTLRNRLKNMHKISEMCSYPVHLNYRRPGEKQNIATLNEHTALNISELVESDTIDEIEVIITRFNTFTGNGRLLINGDVKTISFGFLNGLKYVTESQKKIVSQNLHDNNDVPEENRKHITLRVKNLAISNGDIVKYLITEVI